MIFAPGADPSVLVAPAANAAGPVDRVGRAPLRVREWRYRYEDEGSEHRALGSVAVSAGAWWCVALSVPAGGIGAPPDTGLVRCERHGDAPAEYRGDGIVELLLPRAEVGAVALMLAGVVE